MPEILKTSPKDFFLHLAVIAGLYISAGSLLALLFSIINTAFPDRLTFYSDPYSTGIRLAIASLVIIFPLYVAFSVVLNREYRKNIETRNLGIRKWLLYLTLFIAVGIIAGDLVALVNSFLSGETTMAFFLKVLSVLVVAGFIFGYYFYDLRRPNAENKKIPYTFAALVSLIVIASIISGFYIMGSPFTQRLIRFDQQKVSDLENIQWQVLNHWQQKRALPATLGDLEDKFSGFVPPVDPETDAPYIYRVKTALSFELCATFNLPNTNDKTNRSMTAPVEYGSSANNSNWEHGTGETCFERIIDPELYPPRQI